MIVFSDLHTHTFQDFADNRLEIIENVLNEILSVARNNREPVLFAGDLVHKHGYVPTQVLNSLLDVFNEFRDVPIYAINGNHDHATVNFLQSPALGFMNIASKMFNIDCIDYKMVEVGNYIVVGIPYMSRASDFEQVLNFMTGKIPEGRKAILLAHQTPTRLFNSFIPAQIDIDNPVLDRYDFVFMGHIHRYQDFGKGRYMVGNPCVQDGGDIGNDKGYLSLRNGVVSFHRIKTVLDDLVIEARQETVKKLEAVTKSEELDSRLYSTDIREQLAAYCDHSDISEDLKKVGFELVG